MSGRSRSAGSIGSPDEFVPIDRVVQGPRHDGPQVSYRQACNGAVDGFATVEEYLDLPGGRCLVFLRVNPRRYRHARGAATFDEPPTGR